MATTQTYHFAERMRVMKPSPTLVVSDTARQLTAAGHDVVALGAGDPDLPTPPPLVQAAAAATETALPPYVPRSASPPRRTATACRACAWPLPLFPRTCFGSLRRLASLGSSRTIL